jgi:hypothetical protein
VEIGASGFETGAGDVQVDAGSVEVGASRFEIGAILTRSREFPRSRYDIAS